ncbi:MAG: RsmB/NOP family class I SAM-dependent RNA methyltransferase, partial [Caulobacterales bacterium]|nr:RsmB/NOP family class I SAM-dependent RNA methyltransferase [Caulobacterales bacterium]
MRDSGRITAAIDVLADVEDRRRPAKLALKSWGAEHRFAGAKDRAWISGLVLDTLRRRRSLAWRIGVEGPRARVLAALRWSWGWEVERIAEAAAEQPHGSGPLYPDEREGLAEGRPLADAPAPVRGDYPDWLDPSLERAFGEARAEEAAALAARAPVDLRVNALKTTPDKALKALASVGAEPVELLSGALRVAPPAAHERSGHVESIPAFSKGWMEVQDLGSQIAAAAAGPVAGAQVLDLCAGGGGKTLALAAMMGNTGQIYAYDADARRLAPAIHRAQRAGVRNLQFRSPAEGASLADLEGRMDVVFVDAPCTGSGVWRRQPDSKWRLRKGQLERRMDEQDEVLSEAAAYVKPGGRLVFVTCSVLEEEGADRAAPFLAARPDFAPVSSVDAIAASGLASADGLAA